jgi:hypothetical protein
MRSGTCLTSKLYDKIIKTPSKPHETIPLRSVFVSSVEGVFIATSVGEPELQRTVSFSFLDLAPEPHLNAFFLIWHFKSHRNGVLMFDHFQNDATP